MRVGVAVWRGGVVAAGLVAAALAISSGWTATLLHRGLAQDALAFSPGSAAAQRLVSASMLNKGDVDGADRLARDAMRTAPLSAGAIRVAILAAIEREDAEAAAQGLSMAGRLGWRDTALQALLAGTAIASENVHEAAIRADAFARVSSQLDAALALVRAVSVMPGGAAEIEARLVFNPEWRQSFMGSTGKLGGAELAAHEAVLLRLKESGAPATRAELREYAVARVMAGEVARGRRIWGKLIAEAGGESAALFDNRFRAVEDDAGPFEWSRHRAAGVDFSDQEALERGGVVLQIDLPDGASGDGSPILTQQMALTPGSYRFTIDDQALGQAGMADGGSDRLRWIARCRPTGAILPLAPGTPARRGSWERRASIFTVPAVGCDAQSIELLNSATSGGPAMSIQLHSIRIDAAPPA